MKPHNRDEFTFGLVVTGILVLIELVILAAIVGAFHLHWFLGLLAAAVLGVAMLALTYPLRMAAYSVVALWREE